MTDPRMVLVDTLTAALKEGVPLCKGNVSACRSLPVWDFETETELPLLIVNFDSETISDPRENTQHGRVELSFAVYGYAGGATELAAMRKASALANEVHDLVRNYQYIPKAMLDTDAGHRIAGGGAEYIIQEIYRSGQTQFVASSDGHKPVAGFSMQHTAVYYVPVYSDGQAGPGLSPLFVLGEYETHEGRIQPKGESINIAYNVAIENK